MTRIMLAAAACLAASAVSAQTPPAARPGEPGPTPPARAEPSPHDRDGGQGAAFRISGPGFRFGIRCADGESTKACSEIALQMIDKLSAMRPGRGDEDRWSRRRDERGREGYGSERYGGERFDPRERWRDRFSEGPRGEDERAD